MKKQLPLIFATLITLAGTAIAQVPNGGFETWVTNTESPHQYQVPQGWMSFDVIENSFNNAYTGSSVSQTTLSHSGTKAVLLQTAISNGDTVDPFLVTSASAYALFFGSGPGFACTARPANLIAYYKYNVTGGDQAGIGVFLTRWNTSMHKQDTVASGEAIIIASAANYTQLTIPISYSLNVFPDTAIIEMALGAGNNANHPHTGTQLYVDDVSFSGSVPVGIQTYSDDLLEMYPNPATSALHIKTGEELPELFVFNAMGEIVQHLTSPGQETALDVSALPPGLYTVRAGSMLRKFVKE